MAALNLSQIKKVDRMSDDRITNLEIKLSFTEDLIEKLNETIYKQQQQIEFLYRELKAIKEQASSSGGGGGSLKDEIPPHY
jgi:SlyX protein